MTCKHWNFQGYFKYKQSWTDERLKEKIEPIVDRIINKWKSWQIRLDFCLNNVKRVLDRFDITSVQRKYYLLYAILLWSVMFLYEWLVDRKREHSILRYKFESYGLDPNILNEIDRVVIWNKVIQPVNRFWE